MAAVAFGEGRLPRSIGTGSSLPQKTPLQRYVSPGPRQGGAKRISPGHSRFSGSSDQKLFLPSSRRSTAKKQDNLSKI